MEVTYHIRGKVESHDNVDDKEDRSGRLKFVRLQHDIRVTEKGQDIIKGH